MEKIDVLAKRQKYSKEQMLDIFHECGMPQDICWQTILINIFNANSERGKSKNHFEPVFKQALKILKTKNFSDESLIYLIKNYNLALSASYQDDFTDALNEIDILSSDFRTICKNRQGGVEKLKTETIQTVSSNLTIAEKIRAIKKNFEVTIEIFKNDLEKLDNKTNIDHLTGLHNRRFFDKQIIIEAKQALNVNTGLNLLMIDIDNFKKFNDDFGHLIGDQVLKTVAKKIQLICTETAHGIGINLFATRYGGEEFAVIIPAVDLSQAKKTAEKIRQKISSYNFVIRDENGEIKKDDVRLTVSVGVSGLLHSLGLDKGVYNLIKNADMAMFDAKTAGKNCIKMVV